MIYSASTDKSGPLMVILNVDNTRTSSKRWIPEIQTFFPPISEMLKHTSSLGKNNLLLKRLTTLLLNQLLMC